MVIYEYVDGEFYGTQVHKSFIKTKYSREKIMIKDTWEKFRKSIVMLSNDEVFITSRNLVGTFKRNDIKSFLSKYI